MNPDPDPALDPALSVSGFQDAFLSFILIFCLLPVPIPYTFTFTSIFKDKKDVKKSQNSKNKGFPEPILFFLVVRGSASGSDPDN
jgi:hypothetical protein